MCKHECDRCGNDVEFVEEDEGMLVQVGVFGCDGTPQRAQIGVPIQRCPVCGEIHPDVGQMARLAWAAQKAHLQRQFREVVTYTTQWTIHQVDARRRKCVALAVLAGSGVQLGAVWAALGGWWWLAAAGCWAASAAGFWVALRRPVPPPVAPGEAGKKTVDEVAVV